jgi:hypothetical protein
MKCSEPIRASSYSAIGIFAPGESRGYSKASSYARPSEKATYTHSGARGGEKDPGLCLPVDLDQQHPRLEQSHQDREDHARHEPV